MSELSVVIPTYNRVGRLRACLESLSNQSAPPSSFEVVVVVDGSTDGTVDLLNQLSTPFPLRFMRQENAGQNAALNRGLREAAGPLCLFLDDDIVADRELVEEHLRAHRDDRNTVGIGQLTLRIPNEADWFVRQYADGWAAHYEQLNRGERAPSWTDCFGGNLSAPRTTLLDVGGVAPDLSRGHDIELGFRLVQEGRRLEYLPDALGHQDEWKGFSELARDSEEDGAAAVAIYERHPSTLPALLGSFHHTRLRSILLQGAALRLSLPPRLLRALVEIAGKRDERSFHFLRSYCYWRGVKRGVRTRETWKRLTGGTRILMYHAFDERGEGASRYLVSIREFRRQLTWLHRLGFEVLDLEEYLTIRRRHQLPPRRSVVITIDDGYADTAALAAPVLAARSLSATVFPVTERMGGVNDWSPGDELSGRPLMSWEEARALLEQGLSVGAHTRTHPDLTTLSPGAAWNEIRGSREDLQRGLGVPVPTFAYPYGATSPNLAAMAGKAGFLGSCGIEEGLNTVGTPVHDLRRIEVFGTDSLFRFLAKAWLGQTYLPRLRPR